MKNIDIVLDNDRIRNPARKANEMIETIWWSVRQEVPRQSMHGIVPDHSGHTWGKSG